MATKTTIAMFFNTALINFSVNIFYLFLTQGGDEAKAAIFKPQGLVEVQQSILISNAWIPVIVYLVDPARIAKKVFLYLEEKKGEKSVKTQVELNEMMEEPVYDISVRYPVIINSIFVTAFYAPLIPLALIYGCIGLTSLYWAEKYKILRHRSVKNDVGSELSFDMTELLETMLPLYCASNLMFDYLLAWEPDAPPAVSAGALAGIIVGVVHMFLPMQDFNELICFVQPFPELADNYEQSKEKFDSDYDLENPVTAKAARA